MEQNRPIIISKKVWSMVRVILFMLRKGISKGKLMLHLNIVLKRGNKIATKVLANLTFHHHQHQARNAAGTFPAVLPHEYEFSCSSTPNHNFLLFYLNKLRRNHRNHRTNNFFGCGFNEPQTHEDDNNMVTMNAVKLALEMLNNEGAPPEASPWLPRFGESPMVRELRITDSPFLVRDDGDGGVVDKKAEEFIKKFYEELKQQPLENN